MENYFDNKSNDPSLDKDADFRIDNVDFSITGNARVKPSGNISLLTGDAAPHVSGAPDFTSTDHGMTQYRENERIRRENQNAFFGIPRKQDADPWNAGNQKQQPDLYGNSMKEIEQRAENDRLKWNWSGKTDEAFRYRPEEPARNAALKGLQRIGQLNPVAVSKPALPEETESLQGSIQQGWDHARDGLSFRAVGTDAERMAKENANITRKEQVIEDMRNHAERAGQASRDANGTSRYQNSLQAAYAGGLPEDVIGQAADIYETPGGSVWNQFATNLYGGVYSLPPVQWADNIPHGINRVSRALGMGDVVGTFSGLQQQLYEKTDEAKSGDSFLTAPDGTNTAAGEAVEIGNAIARLLPSAAFATLMGEQGMSPGMIGTAFLSGDTSSAYNATEADALKSYDAMPFDRLMQDDYFRDWYRLYSQGGLDPVAVSLAKKDAAASRAADEAGMQIILNLATQKMDKLVPEESESAFRELVKNMAKGGGEKKLGELYRKFLEMGPVIDQGNHSR